MLDRTKAPDYAATQGNAYRRILEIGTVCAYPQGGFSHDGQSDEGFDIRIIRAPGFPDFVMDSKGNARFAREHAGQAACSFRARHVYVGKPYDLKDRATCDPETFDAFEVPLDKIVAFYMECLADIGQ